MNCLDYRRLLLVDPRSVDAAATAHRDACPACAEHARQAAAFEDALADAARIPVDPSLAQRIVLDRRLRNAQQGRRRALAAGVLLAAGAGGWLSMRLFRPDPIALAAIDHVLGEPASFRAHQSISSDELGGALGQSGASVRPELAAATSYLHDCPVPGGWGKHLVINGPAGRFTLITMPSCAVARRATLGRSGLYSAVMPARSGSFAVVAESPSALEAAERFVAARVDWRSA